jgi:hypothetical protein
MRVAKRRLEVRAAIKAGEVIVIQTPTRNWRDRVRAMNAARDAEQARAEIPCATNMSTNGASVPIVNEHRTAQH